MPQRPIEKHWKEAVRHLVAQPSHPKSATIRAVLEKHAARDPRLGKAPSERAIRRIVEEFPEQDRGPYRVFMWPEVMAAGVMDWDASAACLELLRRLDSGTVDIVPLTEADRDVALQMGNDLDEVAGHKAHVSGLSARRPRPLLAVAIWFWRVTQAAPTAPLSSRYGYAMRLAGAELLGDTSEIRRIERAIAYGGFGASLDPLRDGRVVTAGEMLINALQAQIIHEESGKIMEAPDGTQG